MVNGCRGRVRGKEGADRKGSGRSLRGGGRPHRTARRGKRRSKEIAELPPGARRDLLRVLRCPSHVRATSSVSSTSAAMGEWLRSLSHSNREADVNSCSSAKSP